jgi:hypothetical protein
MRSHATGELTRPRAQGNGEGRGAHPWDLWLYFRLHVLVRSVWAGFVSGWVVSAFVCIYTLWNLCTDAPKDPPAEAAARPVPMPVGAAKQPETLDDLVRTLIGQINNSDWIARQVPTGERLWGPDSDSERDS